MRTYLLTYFCWSITDLQCCVSFSIYIYVYTYIYTYIYTHIFMYTCVHMGFPCGSAGKESTCNAGDLGWIPGLGRSPGEGKGYPLQYSGLENSMDCVVHGVEKNWTWLSDFDKQSIYIHTHVYLCKHRSIYIYTFFFRWFSLICY